VQEKEFHQQILGLQSPWFVADVNLDTGNQQVDIHVEHAEETKFCCPECKNNWPATTTRRLVSGGT